MAAYFVDSSVILKRYRYEAGSERASGLLDGADRLFMSRLAQVEVTAAIVRRGRETGLSTPDLTATLERFDRETQNSFDVVELELVVVERAIALARKHGLRGADAVQLAFSLFAHDESARHPLVFLSSDLELNAATSAEGLSVLDPTRD